MPREIKKISRMHNSWRVVLHPSFFFKVTGIFLTCTIQAEMNKQKQIIDMTVAWFLRITFKWSAETILDWTVRGNWNRINRTLHVESHLFMITIYHNIVKNLESIPYSSQHSFRWHCMKFRRSRFWLYTLKKCWQNGKAGLGKLVLLEILGKH